MWKLHFYYLKTTERIGKIAIFISARWRDVFARAKCKIKTYGSFFRLAFMCARILLHIHVEHRSIQLLPFFSNCACCIIEKTFPFPDFQILFLIRCYIFHFRLILIVVKYAMNKKPNAYTQHFRQCVSSNRQR